MCGIVAVIDPTGSLTAETLDRMRDRLAHRGPDGARSWLGHAGEGVVGLGHRRLSIIDLTDAASQPMEAHPGGPILVFNGEIYNYVELRHELEGLGVNFRTRSDSEVLLAAYLQWGDASLKKLNGMFAFAIWDPRKSELFVARDRFGEKPLFLTNLPGGGVALASEMKALFAHPQVEASISPEVLDAYVAARYWEEGEETFFRGVRRLPAAHAVVLDARGATKRAWRWWVPDYEARETGPEAESVEKFRELMERSISMRLRADVPVGSSLSGGLDSSFVVGILAEMRKKGTVAAQNTFSARFDSDPTLSEGPYIDEVAKRAAVHAFAVTPDPLQLVAESRTLHWHQEEPFLSASIYLQWCVMRLARENATTILLDGQGADELLGGYQSYFQLRQLDLVEQRRMLTFVRETMLFSGRLQRASKQFPDSRRRFDAHVAMRLTQGVRRMLRPAVLPTSARTVGVPPLVRGGRFRRRLAEALQYDTLPTLLRYADRSGMAFGRETRFPFLDYDLVDFVTSLPDDRLIAGGWQKRVLRLAGEGILPRSVQWRADKVGYAAPLDVWLRGPLKEWGRDRVFSGPITELPAYDRAALDEAWNAHQERRGENSWALWRWISLNEWLTLTREGAWKRAVA